MDLKRQKAIQDHFEGMHRAGLKPWREHGPERMLEEFFRVLKTRHPDGARVLDIGCGDGWISIRAAKEGHHAWGIDSSETAIQETRAAARRSGVGELTDFRVGDALELPYGEQTFDALIDRGFFHHILPENRSLYFQNILHVLKPSGLLYLSLFTTRNPEGIGQRFTRALIEKLFGPYFKISTEDEDPFPTSAPAHLMHFILERRA